MTEERTKRKLTAIFSADVAGYSRLMGDDEVGTVQLLKEYREIMYQFIQQHRGRVVDSPGDNLLAEFFSVVDATECAVKVQEKLNLLNSDLPKNKRMEFRIGINLGDVIEDGTRIYGDGVNIAARVEGLADGGGICLSGSVFDQIEGKIPLNYEYLGEQTVKNIKNPVRVYRINLKSEKIFAFERELKLPDKPSIAVLPFDNMSGDSTKEYFSDGLTEEIITGLSKIPKLFVIARNSTFTYKGKPVKVQQVSRELGVKYVLEGSVRSAGERVRITAQLIDGMTGQHLWAERYDRQMKDIFAIQDDITMNIMIALQVKLTEGEQARLGSKSIKNLEAYIKVLKANKLFFEFNKESLILARQKYEEAIDLEPDFAAAHGGLAASYMMPLWVGWEDSPHQALAKANEHTQRCLALDDTNAFAHAILGALCLVQHQWDKAIAAGKRAVTLSPNSANILALFAVTLKSVGRVDEALTMIEKAIRLNPMPPEWYLHELGTYYRLLGRYDEAIAVLKRNLDHGRDYLMSMINLTATYSMAGKLDQARAQAREVLSIMPDFSAKQFMKGFPYKDQKIIDDFIENLCKAGLPA
ncbi:MAG: tetratricopeptide repeat protein [Desulfobacteraceae bacterium]|nr:tetratricopeptide repeat protein [Desulfobacteraceae bacterium]